MLQEVELDSYSKDFSHESDSVSTRTFSNSLNLSFADHVF